MAGKQVLLSTRFHGAFRSMWDFTSQFWPGSVTEGVLSASRGRLRQFLLLKLVTVLLFPQGAALPLLVGCVFSLQALLLLRSPHTSTKPSTVLLAHLALADGAVLLQWALRLGRWVGEEAGGQPAEAREAGVGVLCERLLDAHHLACLLLLGLLGLEAALVSRWPQQTRRFRTSQWAQLGCGLVWTLVLLELACLLHFEHQQKLPPQALTVRGPPGPSHGSLPALSLSLRRMLWLGNSWLHYVIFYSKPKRRKSTFH